MAKPTRPQAGRTTPNTARKGPAAPKLSVPAARVVSTSPPIPASHKGIQTQAAARSAVNGPAPEALGLFQQGVSLVQRHAFEAAAKAFHALLEGHQGERAILDRARVYLDLCARELKRQPAAPKTVEERITAATAALNDGEDAKAEGLVKAVLAEHARHDLALYLMAVVHARRGAADAALTALTQAVAVSPEVRAQAKYDADFEILRGSDAFQALTDPPQVTASQRKTKRR